MSIELQGSPGRGQNVTVDGTGRLVEFEPAGTSAEFWIQNVGANDLLIYFSQEDFDGGVNFWTLGTTAPANRLGPVHLRKCGLWLQGSGGPTDVQMIVAKSRA